MNSPAALRRRRDYVGPAIFSYGFRPFFLGGAVWAALSIALWLPQYFGDIALPTAFSTLDWHIHEMIYGYVAATIAGFLLTAIPNWTGRLPVNGYPLAGLFALWLLGRVAIAGSAIWGAWLAAVIDVAFLLTFAAMAFGEIVAGRNWRNLRVLIILGVLIAGNIIFHLEAIRHGSADYGVRIGIAALIGLIMLVGGRILPSFTHNWLARNNPGRLPQAFSRYDAATLGMSALTLVCWISLPQSVVSGILLIIAGLLHAIRHLRWAGDRTLADRLTSQKNMRRIRKAAANTMRPSSTNFMIARIARLLFLCRSMPGAAEWQIDFGQNNCLQPPRWIFDPDQGADAGGAAHFYDAMAAYRYRTFRTRSCACRYRQGWPACSRIRVPTHGWWMDRRPNETAN